MYSGKTIFFAALDWGLGHATRSASILKDLLQSNNIILGTTPLTSHFYSQNFPQILQVEIPSYNISYSSYLPAWYKILLQWRKINKVIEHEHFLLKKIIEQHEIDLVVSDSRFGLYSESVHSIIISHQLNVFSPIFPGIAKSLNHRYINRFSEVWVPDYEIENDRLAGELTIKNGIITSVKFIGPQSFLKPLSISVEKDSILIILSGPEPQRSVLEILLIKKYQESTEKIILVRGSNGQLNIHSGTIEVHNVLYGDALRDKIASAKKIICRSGYSTLMDLHLLGQKKLLLIPTPGQTEQEYLAKYWKEKFGAEVMTQTELANSLN